VADEVLVIKKISFTGSTRVAKILAGYAAGTLKKFVPFLLIITYIYLNNCLLG
jgi:hypothetical protein